MQYKLSGAQSSLGFRVAVKIRGPLASEKVNGALERLHLRHPLIAG